MRSQFTRPIALVFGTRPEVIKLAGVVRLLADHAFLIDTGQHADGSTPGGLFQSLRLPDPHVRLDGIEGRCRGGQIGTTVSALTRMFETEPPAAVIVQGDSNSTSASAQAAHYCGIPLMHVDAGLRSHDRTMPQEYNRRIVGVLADVHCAATRLNAANLLAENTDPRSVGVTGSTIVEATLGALPGRPESRTLLATRGLTENQYVLATIHRPENTDDPRRLETILRELVSLPLPVVFPVHPRTEGLIDRYGLDGLVRRLRRCAPVSHAEFLGLARHARVLVSDSGAVQAECTVVKKPVVVVRNSTDRPEAVHAGFATLVPVGPEISQTTLALLNDPALPHRLAATRSPYGDGKASWRIGLLALAIQRGVPAAEAISSMCISPVVPAQGQLLGGAPVPQ